MMCFDSVRKEHNRGEPGDYVVTHGTNYSPVTEFSTMGLPAPEIQLWAQALMPQQLFLSLQPRSPRILAGAWSPAPQLRSPLEQSILFLVLFCVKHLEDVSALSPFTVWGSDRERATVPVP